ncbi:MAG: acetylxylan esterase, partial [Verrucomicrobia bacterium A1]
GVPAGCDHTGFKVGRINGWPKFIATGEDPPPNVVEAVRYFDAVNFAARAKAPGIVTVGFIDTTCPPTGVYAAYNALSGRKQIFDDIPTGHANSPEAMKAMREAILAHAAAAKTAVR